MEAFLILQVGVQPEYEVPHVHPHPFHGVERLQAAVDPPLPHGRQLGQQEAVHLTSRSWQ